jgi:Tol biopolymer transport system component
MQKTHGRAVATHCLLLLLLAGALSARADQRILEGVSRSAGGELGNGSSFSAHLSEDGRFVAFTSFATNLVPGDTNGEGDIFVKDRTTGAIVRASVSASGGQADATSTASKISSDGRYVAFKTVATNLVPGDTNGQLDVFVKDLVTGALERVSVAADGTEGNNFSDQCSLSGDGRYVAFRSWANNLVPNDTNGFWDIFVKDRVSGAIVRASTSAAGAPANRWSQEPSLSRDGRYVAFGSTAGNLVPEPANGQFQIYRKDLQTGAIVRVSVTAVGEQSREKCNFPDASSDGRFIAFQTVGSSLGPPRLGFNIYVKDVETGEIQTAGMRHPSAHGDEAAVTPSISGDGRFVAHNGTDTKWTGDIFDVRDWEIFVTDLRSGTQERTSNSLTGWRPGRGAFVPSISSDGSYVGFDSAAGNLIPDAVLGRAQVYVASLGQPIPDPSPTNVRATPQSAFAIRVSWEDRATDEDGFYVRRKGPGDDWIYHFPPDTVEFTDTGLTPGTTYTYYVYSHEVWDSDRGHSATATTGSWLAPTNLIAVASSSYRVDLDWTDQSAGEVGFEVWASVDGAEEALVGTTKPNATYFRHYGFTGSHTVIYRVRGVSGSTFTDFSAPATASVLGQPLNLNSRALNSRLIRVAWDDHATNEQVYELWRGVNGGPLSLFHTAPANTPYYTDTVAANGAFTYQVRCRRGPHVSSFTNVDTSPALLAPSGLTAMAVGSGQVDLTWTDNSGAFETAFHVLRRQGSSAFKVVGVVGAGVTTFSDTSVVGGQTYAYRVRAASGNDWSDHSASAKVTTP